MRHGERTLRRRDWSTRLFPTVGSLVREPWTRHAPRPYLEDGRGGLDRNFGHVGHVSNVPMTVRSSLLRHVRNVPHVLPPLPVAGVMTKAGRGA